MSSNVDDAVKKASARSIFNTFRRKFWKRIYADKKTRQWLKENAGITVQDKGLSPYLEIITPNDGIKKVTIDIDHILELNAAPGLAISPHNLQFTTAKENRTLLNLFHAADPHLGAEARLITGRGKSRAAKMLGSQYDGTVNESIEKGLDIDSYLDEVVERISKPQGDFF